MAEGSVGEVDQAQPVRPWAYFESNGVFIPTRYTVTAETEAGTLEIGATAVSAYAASGIRDVPDSPRSCWTGKTSSALAPNE